ncbi:MAG: hypothetical protein IJB75_05290 [Oscillospiraceae bacterium]|nr:hypothetical protein [Oscillospiraceae bacterium]
MDNRFRGSAFGGFNRKDVINYLTSAAAEHNHALEQLNSQLAAVTAQRDEAQQRAQQAEQTLAAMTGERDDCRRQARETAEKADRVPELEAELERLRSRVAELEPDAAAYVAIKERAAGIELEAHQRAQGIVNEAKAQSDRVQEQTRQWVLQVRREYDELRTVVENTVSHAAGDLDRVRQSLGNISLCMDRQSNAMDQFVREAEKEQQ